MRRVMLVEDEEFILEGLENIIDWKALELKIVHKAHHGLEALEMLKREKVDIIVTDVSMPLMNGLELLDRVRKSDSVTRFIILTGYSDFEYARAAIHLDVEDYILKPVNEEKLEKVLQGCVKKLEELEKEKVSHIDEKVELMKFLDGAMDGEEAARYAKSSGPAGPDDEKSSRWYSAAIMKVDMESMKERKITDIIRCLETREEEKALQIFYLRDNNLLLLHLDDKPGERARDWFANLQNRLEIHEGVMSFITVSECFQLLTKLPEMYRSMMKMQKYLPIDGYGSCIDEAHIMHRTSTDVVIDREKLSAFIYRKDVEEVNRYLEDLFINNMKDEVSINVLYQIAVKIAIILQEIKTEYKLDQGGSVRQLSDVIDGIYMAEDIFSIRTLFVSEVTDIVSYLNRDNDQYTPVVRQIIAEVKKNFRKDMNLKTLAYKYHMNTSYLGQIFQKEVGCSFSKYLSNVKNSQAKDLILSTNMRINDIAKAVGYMDTSYFYRKFKQCYGISPASMREMKKY